MAVTGTMTYIVTGAMAGLMAVSRAVIVIEAGAHSVGAAGIRPMAAIPAGAVISIAGAVVAIVAGTVISIAGTVVAIVAAAIVAGTVISIAGTVVIIVAAAIVAGAMVVTRAGTRAMIPAVWAVVAISGSGTVIVAVPRARTLSVITGTGTISISGTRTTVGRARVVALRTSLLRGTRSATAIASGPVLSFSNGSHHGHTHHGTYQFCQYSFHCLNIIYVLEQTIDKRFNRAFKNKR